MARPAVAFAMAEDRQIAGIVRIVGTGVVASAPGWLRKARMKHERSSCGTQCSRTSALRNFFTLLSIAIGLETNCAIGASMPTGMKYEQRTYS